MLIAYILSEVNGRCYDDLISVIVMQADDCGLRQCYNVCLGHGTRLQEFHVDGSFFTNTVVLLLSVGIVSLIFAGKIYESRQ